MALELKQPQVDMLAKIKRNYQGNHTTNNRRKPMIEKWQVLKAKEMLSAGEVFNQIMEVCDISIYKLRRVKLGVYNQLLDN